MRAIEISEKLFFEYKDFLFSGETAECEKYCCALLSGQGSECFYFDDEFSKDHDYEAGFQLVLTNETYEKFGMALQKKYNELPKEYMGLKRQNVSAMGSFRHGVFSVRMYYENLIGVGGVPVSVNEWRKIPEYALATAVNGKVFFDGCGEVTRIREELKKGYPFDVKLKKLSARCVSAAQYGQYNFSRCVKRKEFGAASMCLNGFVENIISVIYLLNNSYKPYYKWCFKGLENLKILGDMKIPLEYLLTEETSEKTVGIKSELIEDISAAVIKELKNQHLTTVESDYLEHHAFSINEKTENQELKSLHIMDE